MAHTALHFALYPAAGERTASSRIRVYAFARALDSLGIRHSIGGGIQADVVFVQKRVSELTLWLARIAKLLGKTVLYDVDDLGDALWFWVPERRMRRMIELADIITTASDKQADYVRQNYAARNVHPVPNAIDYYPTGPVRHVPVANDPLRIMWFGHQRNFAAFEKYLPTLLDLPSVQVVVVTNASALSAYRAKHPLVEFLPWSLHRFVFDLQSCHLTCLTHDGSLADQAKGNNKMTTSITWGVPAVVSRTPEYERTAVEAGVSYALFGDALELTEVVAYLRRPEARARYLENAQDIIWDKYCPSAVARTFVYLAVAGRASLSPFRQRVAAVMRSCF
jgi:hypothetical protein